VGNVEREDSHLIIDYGNRTIGLKIVFFGPAMSGKTTTIRWLFSELGLAEKLTSIENTLGRTMFCDFGTIPCNLSDSWRINAHIWSATGQDFYRSTREVVLVGADGVVFVADSQKHLLDVNLESWNELMAMIIEEERPLPIVVCLNKQDLPYAINEERLRKHLSLPLSVPVFRSVAMSGFNVIEAFQLLFQQSMRTSIMAQAIP
jgi:signal recognition particle receptor subunit beta